MRRMRSAAVIAFPEGGLPKRGFEGNFLTTTYRNE
jgi:hypothetical protein